MNASKDVLKWGQRTLLSRDLLADAGFDVDQYLKTMVRRSCEDEGGTPIEGTETVRILDPRVDLTVRLTGEDIPDDMLVAFVTVRYTA